MVRNLQKEIIGGHTMVPTANGPLRYINLDNAASTPPMRCVMEAVTDAAEYYASVHRGTGYKSRFSTELYEQARRTVANFVGANQAEHTVIFGKNTTEAINKLSYRLQLRRRDAVLISHMEHHSNDLPWRARATTYRIRQTADQQIDKDHFLELLHRYGRRVKLVAITGASNVTGNLPDIHWFARQAHKHGAQMLIDCAQLAAHRKIVMGSLDDDDHLDYVAISAHKMYAPFGSGALIGRADTFMTGSPEYSGGGTVAFVTSNSIDWAEPPDRDEAGSPNVLGAAALAKACERIRELGFDTIERHEQALTKYALDQMQTVPGLTIYGATAADGRLGVIPFGLAAKPPGLIAAILGYEWGIGVRSGCFCAHPFVLSLLRTSTPEKLHIRQRIQRGDRDNMPGLVRVSFGLYNTYDDIDRLICALWSISRGEHKRYERIKMTGDYVPVNDD